MLMTRNLSLKRLAGFNKNLFFLICGHDEEQRLIHIYSHINIFHEILEFWQFLEFSEFCLRVPSIKYVKKEIKDSV